MNELSLLPNIGKKIEANLAKIDIRTLKDLKAMGSIEAWQRIRTLPSQHDTCICALYALEGAIQGVRWHELPEELRKQLKQRAEI